MPCILFRMKMKKTQNVLRIKKEFFEIFLSSQNEEKKEAKWRKIVSAQLLSLVFRTYFKKKGKKIEIEGRSFSLIFYANFEKLKFYRATKSRAVYSNRALGRHLKLSQVIVNVKSSL